MLKTKKTIRYAIQIDMKHTWFIALLVLGGVVVDSKSIQDPVARHDAKQCGTYLCPRFAEAATAYLESGCRTSFKDFLGANGITQGHSPTLSKTHPHTSPTGGHSKQKAQA